MKEMKERHGLRLSHSDLDETLRLSSTASTPFLSRSLEKKEGAEKMSVNAKSEVDIEPDIDNSRKRKEWTNPIEFLFSCIALSVGLGNVWRFPFTAYQNGGGAFLLPYFVVLFFIGKPMYFMELAWGQFSSYGQVKAWAAVPLLKGVGFGELVASICGGSYYCALMAITFYYLVQSFLPTLPWTVCQPEWAAEKLCGESMQNGSAGTLPELYFRKIVTRELDNIDDGIGLPDWRLTMCLAVVWLLIFLTVCKGMKSTGKASYFLALFPYIVLLIFLVRGVTLPGSWEGIRFFIEPQWEKVLEPTVWYAAISQCFFSLSTGFGATIMNASYNNFSHNIYRDAFIINIMDAFTSLLAGFTIFAILGNLASELGVEVQDVVKSGPGLTFVSFPEAVAKFKVLPQAFAVLFFMMLLTLGIGTAIAIVNGIVTVVCDEFTNFKRFWVTSAVCVCGFLVGLIYVTPGGQFLITLVDHFGAGFVIYIMACLEVIGIMWIYGLNNFFRDVEFMLQMKISLYWKFCWGFVVPLTLIAVLTYTLLTSTTVTHGSAHFPDIAIWFGWGLSAIAVLLVPVFAVIVVHGTPGKSLFQKFRNALAPSNDWGPRLDSIREDWIEYKISCKKG